MVNINKLSINKKNISIKIFKKIGVSKKYSDNITDDLIDIVKKLIKIKKLNIKNFGTFKLLKKKERTGRNPKNGKIHIIKSRKSVSFILSKKFNNLINKF